MPATYGMAALASEPGGLRTGKHRNSTETRKIQTSKTSPVRRMAAMKT